MNLGKKSISRESLMKGIIMAIIQLVQILGFAIIFTQLKYILTAKQEFLILCGYVIYLFGSKTETRLAIGWKR